MELRPASKLLLVGCVAAVAWVGSTGIVWPQTSKTVTEADGYVDATLCASCHPAIAASYRKTGMGRSFFRPTDASSVEDYSRDGGHFYQALTDTHFSMQRRGGETFQRRWQLGPRGEEINVEEMKVDYVMGSGNHARSYLSRTAAGTLIELPLGWFNSSSRPGDEAPTGYWDMSPGSDTDHPQTRRFVTYKCMFCHNGIPEIPAANATPSSDPVYTGRMPEGIDCQRCHGPGAAHIRTVSTAGVKREQIRASIVNPARLSPALAMDVCIQCHLETSSTRIPATVVRFDRAPFSYKPGEPFGNFALSFDHQPGTGHDDKFETVSSVYRMRQSSCYTKSAGRLLCQTCHDPHSVPRGDEAVRHYSGVCMQCHDTRQGAIEPLATAVAAGRHPTGGDCIACHMPKRRADDIPRLVMTDHWIQRRPRLTLNGLRAPSYELYEGEVVPYYPAPLPKSGENDLYVAVVQVGLGNNVEKGLPRLAKAVAENKPRNLEFYMVLGDGYRFRDQHQQAITAYRQGLTVQPRSVRALRGVAAGLEGLGKLAEAEATLQDALKIAPEDPETWYRLGLLDSTAGRLAPAADKIAHAIALDPTLPEKSRSLAEVRMKGGDLPGARVALTEALRINPYDEAAWDLSGRLYSQQGDIAQAVFAFERAIRLKPTSAPYLYDYALALARASRFVESQQRVEEALQADDGLAAAHELLGGLYENSSRPAVAIAEYKRALELQPDLARTQLRLGVLLASQGDGPAAAMHLREAAKGRDPEIARQAAEALLRLGVK